MVRLCSLHGTCGWPVQPTPVKSSAWTLPQLRGAEALDADAAAAEQAGGAGGEAEADDQNLADPFSAGPTLQIKLVLAFYLPSPLSCYLSVCCGVTSFSSSPRTIGNGRIDSSLC
jgi:hypothetical protein